MLNDLWNEMPIFQVAEKYQVGKYEYFITKRNRFVEGHFDPKILCHISFTESLIGIECYLEN